MPRKRLKEDFSYQMSRQATKHCVAAKLCPRAAGWEGLPYRVANKVRFTWSVWR